MVLFDMTDWTHNPLGLGIYRKQPDGRWLLARDADTLSPVAE
jgi:hypothetical protein